MVRKDEAAKGLANTSRKDFSKAKPKMATGIVARNTLQKTRDALLCFPRNEFNAPPNNSSHLLRNTRKRAMALAACRATVTARYGELESVVKFDQDPPIHAGIKTACPREEIGKSSVIP
jgi:hypothetical protein